MNEKDSKTKRIALHAMHRWLQAINGRGHAATTALALSEDATVERYGFGQDRGTVMETFVGYAAINAWFALTREICQFQLMQAISSDESGFISCRYQVTAGEFIGGGLWQARLAADGRIAWLSHQPDELAEKWAMPELEPDEHVH